MDFWEFMSQPAFFYMEVETDDDEGLEMKRIKEENKQLKVLLMQQKKALLAEREQNVIELRPRYKLIK